MNANSIVAEISTPGRSTRACLFSPFEVSTNRPRTVTRMPGTMLIRKIQPQCQCWTMTPPIVGPSAVALDAAPMKAMLPMERCLSLRPTVTITCVAGSTSAAPPPCTMRARMSTSELCASPHTADAAVKTTMPVVKVRRQPNTSVRRPPVIIRQENIRMYPVATQSLSEDDMSRSVMIVGSAAKTTVLSMVVMNALTATTASAHRYRPRVTVRTARSPHRQEIRRFPLKALVAIVTIG